MRLQAVEPRRLYRQIADQIRRLIARGRLAPGERLPAERDLARRLGVSRPSLREALIALEVQGLLDVRVGSGIYVARPAGGAPAAPLGDDSGPFEVIRARWMIEGECAALAARHATAAQLRAIRKAHADLLRIERLLRATYREIRTIVASSTPEETAALINLQLVTFAPPSAQQGDAVPSPAAGADALPSTLPRER